LAFMMAKVRSIAMVPLQVRPGAPGLEKNSVRIQRPDQRKGMGSIAPVTCFVDPERRAP